MDNITQKFSQMSAIMENVTILLPLPTIASIIRIIANDAAARNDYTVLAKLTLVCKEWFEIGTRYLWKVVKLKTTSQAEYFRDAITSPQFGPSYKRAMTELIIDCPVSQKWIKDVFSCLETSAPSLVRLDAPLADSTTILNSLPSTLRRQLKSLTIENVNNKKFEKLTNLKSLSWKKGAIDVERMKDLMKIAPQLTHLSLILDSKVGVRAINLLKKLDKVETLEISFDFNDPLLFRSQFYSEFNKHLMKLHDSRVPFLMNLKSLRIDKGIDELCFPPLIAFFIAISRTLTKVHFHWVHPRIEMSALLALSGEGSNGTLKELASTFPPDNVSGSDELWESAFGWLRGLESIKCLTNVSERRLVQAAKNCPKLGRVTLTGCIVAPDYDGNRNGPGRLEHFLETCKQLEEMEFDQLCCLNHHVDAIAHPNLRTVRVQSRKFVGEQKESMIAQIWNQCPKLERFYWNGVFVPNKNLK